MPAIIEALQSLGNWTVFFTVPSVLILLTILLPWLRNRVGITLSSEVMDGASDAFKTLVSSVIFVLAFALYQVEGNYRMADDLVKREAKLIYNIGRNLDRMVLPEAERAHGILNEYANALITSDWPVMRVGKRSDMVDVVAKRFSNALNSMEYSTPERQRLLEILKKSNDDLHDLREDRLAMTSLSLPRLYWSTIGGLLVLLLVLVSATKSAPDKQFAHAGAICAAGLLLSLVIVVDGPFKGDISVRPAAISKVLNDFEK